VFTLVSSIPAILLATVLLVSGVAKLRDSAAVRESFITLRMPPWLTRSIAPMLLPWGEVVLAIALIVLSGPLFVAAAIATLGLFLAYLVIIARANRFDEPVECGCLGRLGLGMVGPVTVVRNTVLVAVAILALVDAFAEQSILDRWLEADSAGWAWLGAVALGVVLTGLMVHAGRDPRGAESPASAADAPHPAGHDAGGGVDADGDVEEADYERTPIPHISLVTPGTEHRVTLRQLATTHARLLVYVNPGCGACVKVLDALPGLRERIGHIIGIHLVLARDDYVENPYLTPEALGNEWFLDPERVFSGTLQLASPGAVLLGADGYLAGGPIVGAQSVIEFFEDIVAVLTEAPATNAEPELESTQPRA
jgi:hypothetical protein